MSRIPPKSKARPTGSIGPPRASSSRTSTARGAAARPERAPRAQVSQVVPPKPETRPVKKLFELPALSLFTKKIEKNAEQKAETKRKVIRKIKHPEEDLPKLKEVLKSIKGQEVSVQEFIGLVSPFTGDNANFFREVLANEMSNFRTMARRIYDTMTQDVSDVLTNEHVQLVEFQKERFNLHEYRMMRAIDSILECARNFNFEAFHEDPDGYLKQLFPSYTFSDLDDEQQDLLLRQQAYHRLQWLRTEGERLSDENGMLQGRLRELKSIQKAQMKRKADTEMQKEAERNQLESVEEQLQEQLAEMSTEVERTIVESERLDSAQLRQPEAQDKTAKKKGRMASKSRFPTEAAQELDTDASEAVREAALAMQSVEVPETSRASVRKSRSGLVKKKRKARSTWEDIPVEIVTAGGGSQQPPRPTSPFHFSPPKSPPRRERSPFHYSPPPAPQPQYQPPRSPQAPPPQARYSPPRPPMQQQAPFQQRVSPPPPSAAEAAPASPPRRRVERTTTVVEPLPGAARRQNLAPRDSWGGFY